MAVEPISDSERDMPRFRKESNMHIATEAMEPEIRKSSGTKENKSHVIWYLLNCKNEEVKRWKVHSKD